MAEMQPPSPPPIDFWAQFWHILQFTQFILFAAFAWVWKKISNVESEANTKIKGLESQMSAHRDSCVELDRRILESKTEIHRDFVTKKDLHDIVESSVAPIRESLQRVDRKLDRLIDRHIAEVSTRSQHEDDR